MKKILTTVLLAASTMVLSCQQKAETYDIKADTEALEKEVDSLMNIQGISEEEVMEGYKQILGKYYERHRSDSMGLRIFGSLAAFGWDETTLKEEYEKADTLIKNNERVKRYITLAENKSKTAVGCKYIDIKGPEAKTGEEISISQTLAGGKMVLLDFWASWCAPCRKCIKEELPAVAEMYADKLTILGIDVWEKKREDLDAVMPTLPITWPVIYTGDRDQSPADLYGVTGIPTLVLLSPDGTILARGQMEEINKILNPEK